MKKIEDHKVIFVSKKFEERRTKNIKNPSSGTNILIDDPSLLNFR